MEQKEFNIDLNENLSVYQNIAQDCIVITQDKLELVLLKTEKSLSARNSWITPLSLAITCGVSLISSNYKDFILPASVWEAIFILSTFIFVIWLGKTLVTAWRYRKSGNIQNIISQIKSESKTQ